MTSVSHLGVSEQTADSAVVLCCVLYVSVKSSLSGMLAKSSVSSDFVCLHYQLLRGVSKIFCYNYGSIFFSRSAHFRVIF